MNNVSGIMMKELVVANLKELSQNSPGSAEENHEIPVCLVGRSVLGQRFEI
jgi:hypothetical protein